MPNANILVCDISLDEIITDFIKFKRIFALRQMFTYKITFKLLILKIIYYYKL